MKPDTTLYQGRRWADLSGCQQLLVAVDGVELFPEPSLELRKHSASGFQWGYPGSGSVQLALAVLWDFTGDRGISLVRYQHLKRTLVASLPDRWNLLGADLRLWLESLGAGPERNWTPCRKRPATAYVPAAGEFLELAARMAHLDRDDVIRWQTRRRMPV